MRIAIGFDFDHTLAVDNRLERTALIALARELGVGIGENDVARLAQIDTLLEEMRLDRLTLHQLVTRFVHSIRKDHATRGLSARFKQICYDLVPTHVVAVPGAHETFAGLARRGVAHAILTNGWSPLQEKKAAAIGYDGPVLVSGAMGVAKPSAAAFARLGAALPAGTRHWYVGDNPATDVRASLEAGFEAVWCREHAGVPYPSHLPRPSAVIDRLPDLLALVDGADAAGKPGRPEATPKI
jgi:FMN phosphatase YigB (HAD superfamily)